MKLKIFRLIIFCLILHGCNKARPEPDYYQNEFTGEFLSKVEFDELRKNLVPDTTNEKVSISFRFTKMIEKGDSLIQPFKYDLRIGKNYIKRSADFEKIGKQIEPHKFKQLNGDSITIGGKTEKPTFINLWFTTCRGCIAEMPVLNKIQNKYKDQVNFVAITFNDKREVEKFLEKRKFDFNHLTSQQDFIDIIATRPYPENIIIDTSGVIRYIEGGILAYEAEYFKDILEELLQPTSVNGQYAVFEQNQ